MVRQLIRQVDEQTRELSLDDGSVFDLDTVSGTDWTRDRLDRLTAAVQAQADTVIELSRLPADDPDKTATARQLFDEYGDRVFLDGLGNIVHRSVKISFSLVDGALTPRHVKVR